tara:strand:+ start:174 stop:317 length:144 start_codon:yes stop_codon:yes gene_type:complete
MLACDLIYLGYLGLKGVYYTGYYAATTTHSFYQYLKTDEKKIELEEV